MRPKDRPARSGEPNPDRGALHLYLRCHGVVCAIEAALVERLFIADEVPVRPADAARAAGGDGESDGLIGVVEVGGRRWAAWDLGAMVGLPNLSAAWILLRGIAGAGGAEVPLALRTGPCLLVASMPMRAPLPRQVFRRRRAAFPALFPAGELAGGLGGELVGLILDPTCLWTPSELAISEGIAGGEGIGLARG